jgi:hypothetical protein
MPDVINNHKPRQEQNTLHIVDENLRGGFAQLPRPVLKAKRLSPKAKTLYVLLLDYAWRDDQCFPGQDRLAQDLDVSIDTISRALKELRDYKLIDWKQQGLNRPNIYYILRLSDNPNLTLEEANGSKVVRTPQVADSRNRRLRIQDSAGLRHKEDSEETDPEEIYSVDSLRHSSSESPNSNIRNMEVERAERGQDVRSTPPKDHIPTPQDAHSEERHNVTGGLALPRGVTTLAAVLTQRRSARTSVPSEARQAIGAYIHDFALELGDQAPLRSTITRAVHLYEASGLSISEFIGRLHAARSIVKEYSGNVRKGRVDASHGWKPANKVPYFFAVLEDQLGLRPDTDTEQSPTAADDQPDREAILPAALTSYERPRRNRRTIGGPLVRVIPPGDPDEQGLQAAPNETAGATSATGHSGVKWGQYGQKLKRVPIGRRNPTS